VCVRVFSPVQSSGTRFRGIDQFDGLEQQRPETGENDPHGVFERRGRRAEMAARSRSEGSRSR